MNKQHRLPIVLLVVTFIFGIFVGNIPIPSITLNSGISIYRVSAENHNRKISTYSDIVRSEKHSVVQPHEFPMQYRVTVKCAYDNISVSAYRSEQQGWTDEEIVDLGDNQYSINAIPVFYSTGYTRRQRTVTYCISICKGENVSKYYFTTRDK